MWQSSGLMAMAAFRMTSSLGPAVGMGASPTSSGVLASRSHAALLMFDAMLLLLYVQKGSRDE